MMIQLFSGKCGEKALKLSFLICVLATLSLLVLMQHRVGENAGLWSDNNTGVPLDVTEGYHVPLVNSKVMKPQVAGNSTKGFIVTTSIPANVSCDKLFAGDPQQLDYAEKWQLSYNASVKGYPALEQDSAEMLAQGTSNCSRLVHHNTPSSEEVEFPIAFSLLVYTNAEQVARLLRAIYQPQNVYCLHVDEKSSIHFKSSMMSLASCFHNVFVSSVSTRVLWGQFGVLEAELICMAEVLQRHKRWRYFINLTGQEFPLQTNLDLVRVLKVFDGANDIYGRADRNISQPLMSSPAASRRFRHRWQYVQGTEPGVLRSPPPHNLTVYKGSVHIMVSRQFVHFILNDHRVQEFLQWVRDTPFPEEIFFATIQHNPHLKAPGTYTEYALIHGLPRPQVSRHKHWLHRVTGRCHGAYLRHICIPSVRDLPGLAHTQRLFLNKVLLETQPLVYHCLEWRHHNRTLAQSIEKPHQSYVDLDSFRRLTVVQHHL